MPGTTNRQRVGIEKIRIYPGPLSLDVVELAKHREYDAEDVRKNLMCIKRSVNPLWEDPITMAVNAAKPMLSAEDREKIELVVVGTESSVDQAKPASSYMMRYLDLNNNARSFETKSACNAGTAAVMMAAHWVASGVAGDAKALVICTDQSRNHMGKNYEFVMGAGAVAILVSNQPKVIEYKLEHNGYFANEAADTMRPTSLIETGNGEESLFCYMDALEGAYAHFKSRAGDHDLDTYFKNHIYHVPFSGITFQAHRTLMRNWKRLKKSEVREHWEQKVLPALTYTQQIGSTYSGSTFIALAGTIDHAKDLNPGDRLGIFSYGSGYAGEFYSAKVCPEAKDVLAKAGLADLLAKRRPLSIPEYEALENARLDLVDKGDFKIPTDGFGPLYEERFAGQGYLTLKANNAHIREYGWA